MSLSFIRKFTYLLLFVTLSLNIYIFTYPSLNPKQCSWHSKASYKSDTNIISTYLNDLYNVFFTTEDPIAAEDFTTHEDSIRMLAFGDPQIKGNWPSTPMLKRLDTYGNDHYLGHIYRVMQNRLNPSHVAVLGDLFSSQWIGDSEFFNRTRRYISRLYNLPEEQQAPLLNYMKENERVDWASHAHELKSKDLKDWDDWGFEEVYDWTTENFAKRLSKVPLLLNVSGNHDIGYSGDATWQHMTRYHKLFGKDNFWIEYNKGTPSAFRIVVLNTLLLEGPALQPEFLDYTWEFLYKLFEQRFDGSTILLTHVPFYKEEGLCVDGPFHDYYNEKNVRSEHYKVGKLRAQNHLNEEVSMRVLNLIFDKADKYPGVILTGHDHEGCETWYNLNETDFSWTASKTKSRDAPSVKEITVRAMMGEYGGNTGLLTGDFNKSRGQWDFTFTLCPFAIQHVWWVTKIVSIITVFLTSAVVVFDL
ncbi:hypothetical protein WICPIJ_002839 [Wickerhamomyces pijperi]|uniref:Calcineurin-like phosphoesterase domain-containing protein n=1 Tax=Wickerhamomyces pijperi TaxID=599730 RepID=A0A9P8QB25_WICPI|nr:hypothetical protein WICPIJ_002839 [Wickerhamomyces pijperi]